MKKADKPESIFLGASRRLYQADSGGDCLVPLDRKWGMQGETLTPPVREAVHYASGHNTPEEVEMLLRKCALFNPSRTAILHANATFGATLKRKTIIQGFSDRA